MNFINCPGCGKENSEKPGDTELHGKECPKIFQEESLKRILELVKKGFIIVSSNELPAKEIANARLEGRIFVDDYSFGYVALHANEYITSRVLES